MKTIQKIREFFTQTSLPYIVGIYGETCAGKSTLGKNLSLLLNCPYISFGDIKRQKIISNDPVGNSIKELLQKGKPINAKLGYSIIKDSLMSGLNLASGYPISINEFKELSKHNAKIIGTIILEVNESTIIKRFNQRSECPICQRPGIVGSICPIHKILMMQRNDATLSELVSRRKLYIERIYPFLKSNPIQSLPNLLLNSSYLDEYEILQKTESWIMRNLVKNGGIK